MPDRSKVFKSVFDMPDATDHKEAGYIECSQCGVFYTSEHYLIKTHQHNAFGSNMDVCFVCYLLEVYRCFKSDEANGFYEPK